MGGFLVTCAPSGATRQHIQPQTVASKKRAAASADASVAWLNVRLFTKIPKKRDGKR